MQNHKIPNKNKSLSIIHINSCSFNKSFEDLQHVRSCANNSFDKITITIIAVAITRITCPVGIYLLKVSNRNTSARCEICSKLIIKTPERCH